MEVLQGIKAPHIIAFTSEKHQLINQFYQTQMNEKMNKKEEVYIKLYIVFYNYLGYIFIQTLGRSGVCYLENRKFKP